MKNMLVSAAILLGMNGVAWSMEAAEKMKLTQRTRQAHLQDKHVKDVVLYFEDLDTLADTYVNVCILWCCHSDDDAASEMFQRLWLKRKNNN